jgi:hypothetical protein
VANRAVDHDIAPKQFFGLSAEDDGERRRSLQPRHRQKGAKLAQS